MAKKEERFVQTYTQGVFNTMEIWVDKVTGVNYLFHYNGDSSGMTVLLDRDGRPVVSPLPLRED